MTQHDREGEGERIAVAPLIALVAALFLSTGCAVSLSLSRDKAVIITQRGAEERPARHSNLAFSILSKANSANGLDYTSPTGARLRIGNASQQDSEEAARLAAAAIAAYLKAQAPIPLLRVPPARPPAASPKIKTARLYF